MNQLEQAKIATDLLNALSPMFIYVFMSGVVFGVFFFGRLVDSIDRLSIRFRRPKRIRFRNLNGRHERKDNFEYLYLFEGEYYTLEQRDFLVKERLKDIKKFSPLYVLPVVLFTFFIISILYWSIKLNKGF